jgi:hypothetical protein
MHDPATHHYSDSCDDDHTLDDDGCVDDVDTAVALNNILDDIDYQTTLVDLRNDFVDALAAIYTDRVYCNNPAAIPAAALHAALTNPPRNRQQ